MRRTRQPHDDAPGQDSFLDIVANLVGILIILVMIVGAQAKDAMMEVEVAPEPAEAVDVGASRRAAQAARQEVDRLMEEMKQQRFEIAYRRSERDRILTYITAAEKTLEQQSSQLDKDARQAHDLHVQWAAARQQLDDLKLSQQAVKRATAPVKVIKHRPTPLAKTVFGKEIHFRLKSGRLAFVPLDQLVQKFQVEARQKAWKLRQAPRITETVGPVRGFRLQYTLRRASYSVETQVGAALQQRVELDHFTLVPTGDDLGEPFDRIDDPDSEFRTILAGFDPNQVTVTVWVYPDSFAQFRTLKDELYKLGFLTASRPLPEGQPISGSPNGSHSAVQ